MPIFLYLPCIAVGTGLAPVRRYGKGSFKIGTDERKLVSILEDKLRGSVLLRFPLNYSY